MIKVLTLHQPWATLVATGDKRLETRSWQTSYRGPLAIHAAKILPDYAHEFYEETQAVRTILSRAGYLMLEDTPLGCVVATCQLVGCESTDSPSFKPPSGKDRILGSFGPGRYVWHLEDIMRLPEPIPARGAQQLWEWDEEAAGIEVLVTGRLF